MKEYDIKIISEEMNQWLFTFADCVNVSESDLDQFRTSLINVIKNETNNNRKKYLNEFFSTFNNFLEGKLSIDSLYFYISRQFILTNQCIERFEGLIEKNRVDIHSSSNNPKVSVIITTFNRKEYLQDAVASILKQNYSNLEIVIVDDNSDDGTDQLINEHYKDNFNLKYQRNHQNMGPAYSRKLAFETLSDGNYILFLDDDDYLIDSNYISEAVQCHQTYPNISFVAANVFLEYTQTGKLQKVHSNLNGLVKSLDYFINFGKKEYPKPVSTLTTLFKRKSLIQMNLGEMKMVNDTSLYLRSLLVGDALIINKVVGVYRIHGNNITFHLKKDFIIENLNEKKEIRNIAIKNNLYQKSEIENWFDYNSWFTISYYLHHSAEKLSDFKSMWNWTKENAPKLHQKTFLTSLQILTKHKLKKIPLLIKLNYFLKSRMKR